MSIPLPEPYDCPDCTVPPGELHTPGCDVARCAHTGRQRSGCHTDCNTRWTGHWPGDAEAFEYGWVLADITDPDGNPMPDLNRLHAECDWDPALQRMVPRRPRQT
ncbi:hypothetical protein [Streptomyces sp. NPDC091278]|uniref:hypothetical protein n=1 Tax=Streptomyces sp. NPDC091278 TaxID=3155301 RepID=UPI003450F1C9